MAQIVAKYVGTCRKCGGSFAAGTKIEWSRGSGSTHVVCPEKASSTVQATDVSGAPFEVYEQWTACRRAAQDARLAAVIGETRRYEKKLPATRKGSTEKAQSGVYVVVAAGKWNFQSTEDNEDMGDMSGANWSGPLYLRTATAEEAEQDAQRRWGDALPNVLAAYAGLKHRAAKKSAEQEMSAAERRVGNVRAALSYSDSLQLTDEERESHHYIYDWDQPNVYVGPEGLVGRAAVAEAIIGWGYALQSIARRDVSSDRRAA